ncbi:hypothetical protein ACE6H2_028411 [Prunus campanulata]
MKTILFNFGKKTLFSNTTKLVVFLFFMILSAVNSNPPVPPMKPEARSTGPIPPHGPNPCNPKGGKKSWPEVVGQSGEDAAAKIERENHNVRAIIILEGSATTLDRRCDRVWVWVNRNGTVTKAPKVG